MVYFKRPLLNMEVHYYLLVCYMFVDQSYFHVFVVV